MNYTEYLLICKIYLLDKNVLNANPPHFLYPHQFLPILVSAFCKCCADSESAGNLLSDDIYMIFCLLWLVQDAEAALIQNLLKICSLGSILNRIP